MYILYFSSVTFQNKGLGLHKATDNHRPSSDLFSDNRRQLKHLLINAHSHVAIKNISD